MSADKQNKVHAGASSIVARLNTRLFFRLLGIYLGMDLLLTLLFAGGLFLWAERQAVDISALVEARGVPSAEATVWMEAGDYTVTAGEYTGSGWRLPNLGLHPETGQGERYFDPGDTSLFFGLIRFHRGGNVRYTVSMPDLSSAWATIVEADGNVYWGEVPMDGAYHITLDLSTPTFFFALASRVLFLCQLISLISNLFRNAGTIRKVLKPIQELAAAAAKLSSASTMRPEELKDLAGKLDEINATHLDQRISVPGTQKELKTLAEAINAMLDRINDAYRSQMRFVSDASHELRTPIAVIQGYANLLDRWGKDDPATRQEAIDAITSEAAAMKELIEQLLFLARGDNDSMHIEPETFDLCRVAAQVLKETEMIDQAHCFSSDLPGQAPVCADLGLIKQALRILVDNSIKYTPPGGRITLSCAAADGTVRLSVQDEGQGIESKSLPHIFDRFFRTDESRARQTGGTGLGLSIAKWIVDRHGGWFEVLSREGIGTRMTVILPTAAAISSDNVAENDQRSA